MAGVGWLVPPPDRAASKTSRGAGVPPASVKTTYAYDDADRLTAVRQGKTTVKGYGYDAAGRTTSVVPSAGTTTLPRDRPRFRGRAREEDRGPQGGD